MPDFERKLAVTPALSLLQLLLSTLQLNGFIVLGAYAFEVIQLVKNIEMFVPTREQCLVLAEDAISDDEEEE